MEEEEPGSPAVAHSLKAETAASLGAEESYPSPHVDKRDIAAEQLPS